MKTQTKDFLLEIGVEEIPAGLVIAVKEQLAENFRKELKKNLLYAKDINSYATPQRLVLEAKLASQNEPEVKKIQGPSETIAFDAEKKPTAAYKGFLKSQGVRESDIKIERTPKGAYLVIEKREKAKKTEAILKEIIPQIILSIALPKYMRWDDSGFKFIRPLRWAVVIFGNSFLEINIGNVLSGDFSLVKKEGVLKRIKIKGINDYFKKIRQENVILDNSKRKDKIKQLICKNAEKIDAEIYFNPDLLSEVVNLVEQPAALVCDFNKEFLKLPEVVLLASMAKYQRVFALVDKDNLFLNKFIALTEGESKNRMQQKKHYEFVLNARLKDADFFFKEDVKENLENKTKRLDSILFHEKLGSVLDKIQALKEAAEFIAGILSLDKDKSAKLARALHLAKADLLTKMVYEFPSLEGVMGGIYARYFGETDDVASAIQEHYLPRTNEDGLPNAIIGALVSLLDKLYNVIGFLGIGIVPSGSEDPFTIRRQVQSIIRILIQYQLDITIDDLFSAIYKPLQSKFTVKEEKIKELFSTLCKERFQYLMREENIPQDLITAVIEVNFHMPSEVYLRIRKLLNIYKSKDFFAAAKVAERTGNIVKDANDLKAQYPDTSIFSDEKERKLFDIYLENKDEITAKIKNKEYAFAMTMYGKVFYDIIHSFFDTVLVNVEDEKIKKNRKVLLYLINELLKDKVADLKGMEVLKDGKQQ